MFSSRSAPKSRCAVPGTPIMPAPSMFSSAMPSIVVMPFTMSCDSGFAQISVPGFSGANVLRIQMGIERPTAGAIVCGWMTFAPKYASSIASLYDSESITCAFGTRRGSAESTPSTSVQMWISAASSSAPKIEPEKSLPLRPSVVWMPSRVRAMKPVMISAPVKSGATSRLMAAVEGSHSTAGPSEAHSTTTHRRASIQRTGAPLAPRRCARYRANSDVDQISP